MSRLSLTRSLAAIAALLGLAACGSQARDATLILRSLPSLFSSEEPAVPTAEQVAQVLAGSESGVVLLQIEVNGAQPIMVESETNRGFVTYVNAGRQSVTLRDGLITGVRGLGIGLMSSETDALARAIRAGGGADVPWTVRLLTPEDVIDVVDFTCAVASRGGPVRERVGSVSVTGQPVESECTTEDGLEVTNRHLVSEDSRIVSSRQWAGAETGYLRAVRLR